MTVAGARAGAPSSFSEATGLRSVVVAAGLVIGEVLDTVLALPIFFPLHPTSIHSQIHSENWNPVGQTKSFMAGNVKNVALL